MFESIHKILKRNNNCILRWYSMLYYYKYYTAVSQGINIHILKPYLFMHRKKEMCAKYERCDILHFETANPATFNTFYEQKTICMIKTHNALIANDTISIVLVPDHAKIFI